ncbi:MAG: hypothetical protein R3C40_12315 [Parvularculaceae bacterium]
MATEVPRTNGYGGGDAAATTPLLGDDYVAPAHQRRMDDFIQFGIAAAQMAFEDPGWS